MARPSLPLQSLIVERPSGSDDDVFTYGEGWVSRPHTMFPQSPERCPGQSATSMPQQEPLKGTAPSVTISALKMLGRQATSHHGAPATNKFLIGHSAPSNSSNKVHPRKKTHTREMRAAAARFNSVGVSGPSPAISAHRKSMTYHLLGSNSLPCYIPAANPSCFGIVDCLHRFRGDRLHINHLLLQCTSGK
jgi:hypothetical protein